MHTHTGTHTYFHTHASMDVRKHARTHANTHTHTLSLPRSQVSISLPDFRAKYEGLPEGAHDESGGLISVAVRVTKPKTLNHER